jgi:hypothetical protein
MTLEKTLCERFMFFRCAELLYGTNGDVAGSEGDERDRRTRAFGTSEKSQCPHWRIGRSHYNAGPVALV